MVKIKAFYINPRMKGDIKLTWKDAVKEALSKIGNSGHLDETLSQYRIFLSRGKGGYASTKSLSISNMNNKIYGVLEQYRLKG